jgi:hypothetical protein
MFGDRDILAIYPCSEHVKDVQPELLALREKLLDILKDNK